ncbi:MAG: DMT family transporter [Oscillospiraceae bacterium]|jgi:transporter family-2 protein|nr:DMT family transporter [Oscillospiraceae bacterium]
MWGILIAVVSGLLMSVQGVFNTGVTKQTSMWACNMFVQLTAFIVCLAMWAITDRSNLLDLFKIDNKYMLVGGIMGALITFTVIKSMDSLGPAHAVMIIVIAQLLIAYLIELFGMFGVEKVDFDLKKFVGIAIAIGGIVLFKWDDTFGKFFANNTTV